MPRMTRLTRAKRPRLLHLGNDQLVVGTIAHDVRAAARAATDDVGTVKVSAGADAGLDRPAEGGDDGAPRGDGSASPQSHGG